VYANDDTLTPNPTPQSTLPAGHPLTPNAGGTYYLAISSYRNRPISQGGEIFDFVPPFTDRILGPLGPGGSSPVSGWNEGGSYTGTYEGRRIYSLPSAAHSSRTPFVFGFGMRDSGMQCHPRPTPPTSIKAANESKGGFDRAVTRCPAMPHGHGGVRA
jgi:hypothetical protein